MKEEVDCSDAKIIDDSRLLQDEAGSSEDYLADSL